MLSLLWFLVSLLKIDNNFTIQTSVLKIHDPLGVNFLPGSSLGLGHHNEHRFRHNF